MSPACKKLWPFVKKFIAVLSQKRDIYQYWYYATVSIFSAAICNDAYTLAEQAPCECGSREQRESAALAGLGHSRLESATDKRSLKIKKKWTNKNRNRTAGVLEKKFPLSKYFLMHIPATLIQLNCKQAAQHQSPLLGNHWRILIFHAQRVPQVW